MAEKEINHTHEWICGKTRITVQFREDIIDVHLYPDYPNSTHLNLYITFSGDEVTIEDLVGNGHQTDYQAKGFGKQIFNIGLQAIYKYCALYKPKVRFEDVLVIGKVSDQDDPEEKSRRDECRDRRNGFWAAFGFKLKDKKAYSTSMKALLVDLKPRMNAVTSNGDSVFVPLEVFWLEDERPKLNRHDVNYLESIDLSAIDLNALPSTADITKLEEKYATQQHYIEMTSWVAANLLLFGLLLMLMSLAEAASIALPIAVLSKILFSSKSHLLLLKLPAYKECQELIATRIGLKGQFEKTILDIETRHNGFIWRVWPYLCGVDKKFNSHEYRKLCIASEEMSITVADDIPVYLKFIDEASEALI